MYTSLNIVSFFFFNDTATTEIYTLSLHDALPIYLKTSQFISISRWWSIQRIPYEDRKRAAGGFGPQLRIPDTQSRSEEHTSELQSQSNLVCRLLLEKKKVPELVSDAALSRS